MTRPEASSLPFSPDYIASCCNEAGMRRQALGGKVPRNWLVRDVTIANLPPGGLNHDEAFSMCP